MSDLKWQDPPAARGRLGGKEVFTGAIRAALRANPGKWAVVHTSHHTANATTWKVRHGADGFEFTQRTVFGSDPKRYDVYARFNPEAVAR